MRFTTPARPPPSLCTKILPEPLVNLVSLALHVVIVSLMLEYRAVVLCVYFFHVQRDGSRVVQGRDLLLVACHKLAAGRAHLRRRHGQLGGNKVSVDNRSQISLCKLGNQS